MKNMNLPNKLTVLRLCMVPAVVIALLISDGTAANIVALVLFCLASLTDMLDGKIARKYNLITDFGKFLDPLADKFMVIGAMSVILYRVLTRPVDEFSKPLAIVLFVTFLLVIFRELGITSLRLVVSAKENIVVAANLPGKIKTCTQIAAVIVLITEPLIYRLCDLADLMKLMPASLVLCAATAVMTVWSGAIYCVQLFPHLDPGQ